MALTGERGPTEGLPQQTPQFSWLSEPSTFESVAQAAANGSDYSVYNRPTGTHRSVFQQVRLAVRRYGSYPEVSYQRTPDTAATRSSAAKPPERPSLKTRFSSFDIASGFRELERRVSDVSHVLGVHQFHLAKPHPSTNTLRVSEPRFLTVRYGSDDHVPTAMSPNTAYLSPDMKDMHTTLSEHRDSVIILLESQTVSGDDGTKDNDTIYAEPSPSSSSLMHMDLPTTLSFGEDDTFASLDVTPIATPRPSIDLYKHYHRSENIRTIPEDETSHPEPLAEEVSFNIPEYGLDDYEYHFDHDEAYDEVEKVDIEIAFDIPDHQPDSTVCPINMVGHLRSLVDSNGQIKVRRCPLHSSDEFCIKGRMVRRGHHTRVVWSQRECSI